MTLKWGILATGNIAATFASAANASIRNDLIAVASRTREKADAFAARFDNIRSHGSYEALLADPEVEAVYIATPHPDHADWTIRALQAGKHVLCEKPLGLNHPEVMAMIDAAEQAGRFLMEAFMYRCHPQTAKMMSLLGEGAIGDIVHIRATFGFKVPYTPESRLFANRLAGGAILDVGCYPVSAVRLITGSEPVSLEANGSVVATGVDEWAAAQLSFDGGISAQIATGITARLDNSLEIFGREGRLVIASPWMEGRRDGTWAFELERDGTRETVQGKSPSVYEIEIDHVAEQVSNGRLQSPAMNWQDSLGNARVLDEWRQKVGVIYETERAESHRGPLLGRVSKPSTLAKPGNVPHLDKSVSRLVMGCDNQPGMSHAAILWDSYLTQGGNCFDTAHIYGGGAMETLLGHWQEQRQIRDDIVIIGKGGHTPHNHPRYIAPQLDESLARLRTDHVDVYFLHRDNLDVPVAEYVDAVNDEIQRGRIRVWGGSNWTLPRIQAANDYAESSGLQGMSAVSNNFSLAHMIKPLWPGVQTSTSAEFRNYLQETGIALMPWSSQARGFFTPWAETVMRETGRENPVITSVQPTMAELAETWFSEENFQRRERAVRLAEERGVEPIQIALAYVICQPFPCFPLIGPRRISEIRSSLAAIDIDLSPSECRWLNLEDPG
jgi:predicted dehydrogenase/aryl-alcohol dehydrogenase-like predicted oxidoreductase